MPGTPRLRKHAEFVRAQRAGRRVGTAHFTLLVAAQPPPPRPARIGLVVSRAVGNAVHRNRVKRLCRECFRLSPGLLPDGVDLVVIARPGTGADALALEDVRSEWQNVERLLKRRAAEALAGSGSGSARSASAAPAKSTKSTRANPPERSQ